MKVALAQLNSVVGDIEGNTQRVLETIRKAIFAGAKLVVFPELMIFGYPPRDLVYRDDLVERNVQALDQIALASTEITTVVGYVQPNHSGQGKPVFNAAAICHQGEIVASYAKSLLPTYDVFDEARYFNPGTQTVVHPIEHNQGVCRIGLTICEDLWNDTQFEGRCVYGDDPVARTVQSGADLIINLSASPFRAGVWKGREELFTTQMRQHNKPLVYVNQVGGQDDVLFDGASLVLSSHGEVLARAKAFEEDLMIVDPFAKKPDRVEVYPTNLESIHAALVMGIRDYIRKCGFDSVLVGLSGGIDSAVTVTLAVESLGQANVHGIAMPSRYSSSHSVEDAQQLADNLGIRFTIIPIEKAHSALEEVTAPLFAQAPKNASTVAEENLQARIRGTILMGLSNTFGSLLLTTGNKSEWAVGYCTLYGDMCGGLAVLNDVPKTTVFDLARHLNQCAGRAIIPQRTISKPPSAELREHQTDQDTLPPYETLDAILEQYVTQGRSLNKIIENGFDPQIVRRVVGMVDRSEHKRKQAPVGLKVTSRAFGTGWRMPIAAKWSH